MFFPVIAVSESSTIGCQDNFKPFYFQLTVREILLGFLLDQRKLAKNYQVKFILTP